MEGLTTDVRMAIADLNAEYAACLDERRRYFLGHTG